MAEHNTSPTPLPQTESATATEQPWLWNVVLLNDESHTYDYVIMMLQKLFGIPMQRAFQIAQRVDKHGRAVCLTTHKEHAELKRDQIHGFGADVLIAGCKGSMSAVIEPAEGGDEHDACDDNEGEGRQAL